jgi:hypothetical protein
VFPVRYGLYLCVPYGSHSKQRLFPQTALGSVAETCVSSEVRICVFRMVLTVNSINRLGSVVMPHVAVSYLSGLNPLTDHGNFAQLVRLYSCKLSCRSCRI